MSPACALPLAGMFASVQLKHKLEFSREFRWWLRIQKTQAPALFHDETGPVKRGFILRTACETRHCDLFARPGHRQTLEGLTDHRQLFERRSADQQWKRRFSSFTAGSPATRRLTLSLDRTHARPTLRCPFGAPPVLLSHPLISVCYTANTRAAARKTHEYR